MAGAQDAAQRPEGAAPSRVDPEDPTNAAWWCAHFGLTVDQLHEAVQAAGGDPAAVHEHLLHQGGSAGVG